MNVLRTILFLSCFLFGNAASAVSYHYDFNAGCRQAYEALMALRIQEGNRLLAVEKQRDPGNLIPVFLENYDDFLTLLLTGDEQQYAIRKKAMDARVKLLNKGDKYDPWYRYTKSSAYFQSAVLGLYFNNYLSAASQFRTSFLLLKENQKLFPGFKPNDILAGLEEALIGTIPDNYQWLSRLLGMKGSVRGGADKLTHFLKQDATTLLREEAVLYYCYVKFFLLSERQEVWQYLNRHYPEVSDNLLLTLLKANLAINDNRSALALHILNHRNKSQAYLSVPLFDYQAGIASLRLLDKQTPVYLKRFLRESKGKVFIKSALQKLSLYYLATGNTELALRYKSEILKQGATLMDADKQAQRYAEDKGPLPNRNLVAAALYCDGGLYKKALEQLSPLKPSVLADDEERTAYFYRCGRVYQLMGNTKACLPFYKEAIRVGEQLPGQYAARSTLEAAHIYEATGNTKQAIAYYQQCLNMKNKDFKANLEQQAKAGLNRLGR